MLIRKGLLKESVILPPELLPEVESFIEEKGNRKRR